MEMDRIDENENCTGSNLSHSSSFPSSPSPPRLQNSHSHSSSSLSHHLSLKGRETYQTNPSPLKSLKSTQQHERDEKKRVNDDFLLLKNSSGHQYSMDQNQLLLTQIHGAMTVKGMEEFHAINLVSDITGCHINTLKSIYSHWKSIHTVPSPSSSIRGSANPSHPLHLPPFSIEIECEIHRLIAEYNHEKGFCNTSDILSSLESKFNDISITRNGLARRLRSMGYQWGRTKTVGGMSRSARIARTVIYVKELSLAIEEEKLGNSIICYTDESYVNVRHKIELVQKGKLLRS